MIFIITESGMIPFGWQAGIPCIIFEPHLPLRARGPRVSWFWAAQDMEAAFKERFCRGLWLFSPQRDLNLDGMIHLGDMAYNEGTDHEFQRKFFDVYASLLAHVPVWPAVGNHEVPSSDPLSGNGPYFNAFVLPAEGEAGGYPSSTESYYSFDVGPVHFISLNSSTPEHRKTDSDMMEWLKRDLKKTKSRWLIAFWHHPPLQQGARMIRIWTKNQSKCGRASYPFLRRGEWM